MTSFRWIGLAVLVVASCRIDNSRPNVTIIADVNSLTLGTDDTLVISRTITNGGATDVWLNASVPAYEMTDAQAQPACVDGTLDLTMPELIHIGTSAFIVDERRYALADLENCTPGQMSLVFSGTFRKTETDNDSFTLRTSPAPFVVTAATP